MRRGGSKIVINIVMIMAEEAENGTNKSSQQPEICLAWTVPYTVQPPPCVQIVDATAKQERRTSGASASASASASACGDGYRSVRNGRSLSHASSLIRERCISSIRTYFARESKKSRIEDEECGGDDGKRIVSNQTQRPVLHVEDRSCMNTIVLEDNYLQGTRCTVDAIRSGTHNDDDHDDGLCKSIHKPCDGSHSNLMDECRRISQTLASGMPSVNAFEQACERVKQLQSAMTTVPTTLRGHTIEANAGESEYNTLQQAFNASVASFIQFLMVCISDLF